ncbi:MAG: sulfatase [Bacteroidota bacterium]
MSAPFRLLALLLLLGTTSVQAQQPRNVVLILSDDHRYDFMGFHERAPSWLETPTMDRLAAEGAHLANAFVSTALCSPSRASILTGQYAHTHGVIDNTRLVPEGTVFFPQDLQEAGYETAFIGKWHMGETSDAPRPGFDYWASFPGQGGYFNQRLNINGEHQERAGYITDDLTDLALEWLATQESNDAPFFLYLSHKAVHHPFQPAPRHAGSYAEAPIPYPPTYWRTEGNLRDLPRWAQEQRYSWHGVDYPFYFEIGDFEAIYRSFAETVRGIDDSIGRVIAYLEEAGLSDNTLVLYLGDNGFSLGEHGLLDKRHAYEESMRIPMLAWAPSFIAPGTTITEMAMNVDIAATVLDLAGVTVPERMAGRSLLPLLRGEAVPDWRDDILYEYYWEYHFPQNPTTYALRTDRFKYIFYHGVWDRNIELFDLQADPFERSNLALVPAHRAQVREMHNRLFARLVEAGAEDVAFQQPALWQLDRRLRPGQD